MKFGTLHHLIRRRPFRPVRLTLDDGGRIVIRHPESIAVTWAICLVDRGRGDPLLFEPEKVLSLEYLRPERNGHRRPA